MVEKKAMRRGYLDPRTHLSARCSGSTNHWKEGVRLRVAHSDDEARSPSEFQQSFPYRATGFVEVLENPCSVRDGIGYRDNRRNRIEEFFEAILR